MEVESRPYIEVSVVHSNEPKKAIIQFYEEKAERGTIIKAKLCGDDENPRLLVEYGSKKEFEKTYQRDKKIYETFYHLIQESNGDYTNLFEEILAKKTLPLSDEEDLYLIIKYKTNYKNIIRQNYNFTFKIIDILGIRASFEEVNDGFLLFYKTKEDFEVAQMDLLKLNKIQEFLKSNNLWNDLFKNLFMNLLSSKD